MTRELGMEVLRFESFQLCVLNLVPSTKKTELQFLKKDFRISENLYQSCSIGNVQNFQ